MRRYGVVVGDDGRAITDKTETLRGEMAAARTEILLVDKGGTIEELKARCLEETGFEPPVAPVFGTGTGPT